LKYNIYFYFLFLGHCLSLIPDDALAHLTDLSTLDLEGNDFEVYPNLSSVSNTLKTLILNSNKFTHLPVYILAVNVELRYIYLKNNDITWGNSNPVLIQSSLQQLVLGDNQLEHLELLPGDGFSGLTHLIVMNNELLTFPYLDPVICASIRILDLTNNLLGTVPQEQLAQFTFLKILILTGNPLASGIYANVTFALANTLSTNPELLMGSIPFVHDRFLEPDITTLLDLFELDAQYVGLTIFPTLAPLCPALRKAILNNNFINSIPASSLHGLTSISHIYLKNNNLTMFPDFSTVGSTLSTLILDYNFIPKIHGAHVQSLTNMKYLYLSDNLLTHVYEFPMANMPILLRLNIVRNPLHCDSHLAWLLDPSDLPQLYVSSSPCASPPNLKGILWNKLYMAGWCVLKTYMNYVISNNNFYQEICIYVLHVDG